MGTSTIIVGTVFEYNCTCVFCSPVFISLVIAECYYRGNTRVVDELQLSIGEELWNSRNCSLSTLLRLLVPLPASAWTLHGGWLVAARSTLHRLQCTRASCATQECSLVHGTRMAHSMLPAMRRA